MLLDGKFISLFPDLQNFPGWNMQTDDVFTWVCQYCGEENQLWVDLTILEAQDFIEDCEICCRPNRIIVSHDKENEEHIFVDARLTDE